VPGTGFLIMGLQIESDYVPGTAQLSRKKLIFVVTEDWYFVSHRLGLAVLAQRAGYDVVVVTRDGQHGARIRDAGLRLRSISFNRGGLSPLQDIRTLLSLIWIYLREAPDLVHHVALKPVVYGSLAARVVGVRGIVNALGGLGYIFSTKGFLPRLILTCVKPLLRVALSGSNTRLIVQNSDDRDRLCRNGFADLKNIRLIRGAGVDPNEFYRDSTTNQVPLVILPARLLRQKGVLEFVAAARTIRAKGVKARFALVGKPDLDNRSSVTQTEIDAWVAEGAVEYWGWREDMANVLSQTDIVCLPTFYGEGLPKTLLEGAASGCALIATDIPGCREVVRHGETGWLIPTQDVSALVAALEEAIGQPALRQRFGAAARELVSSHLTLAGVAQETLLVYKELVV